MLTEKYQPSFNEIVGNQKALKRLEECLLSGTAVLVYGTPGIGKTSGVFAIAKKHDYNVLESNASDKRKTEHLKDLLRTVKTRTFHKTIFLVDEVDGVRSGKVLADIIDESAHPLVFTANELWKVPQSIKSKCESIRFYKPRLVEVLGRVRTIAQTEGVRARYDKISGDVRASLNAVMYGGEKYESVNMFDFVEAILRGGDFDVSELSSKNKRNLSVWIADNLPKFFVGRSLHEAYQLLGAYDLYGRAEILKLFKRGRRGKPSYPFFLRRRRAMRGGN